MILGRPGATMRLLATDGTEGKNDEICILNDEFCIKNDKSMKLFTAAKSPERSSRIITISAGLSPLTTWQAMPPAGLRQSR